MNRLFLQQSSRFAVAVRQGQRELDVVLSHGKNVRFGVLYFVPCFFVCKTEVVKWLL